MVASIPRWFSAVTWATPATLVAIVAFTTVAGLTGSLEASATVGLVVGIAVLVRLLWNPPVNLSSEGIPRGMRVLFATGAACLMGQLLFATAFIIDPNLTRWDAGPFTPMRSNHSCVSSYWVANENIRTVPDIFAEEIYSVPQANSRAIRVGRPIGPLIIDQYEYPPAFLVVPRLLAAATENFWGFRRLWFALNLAVVFAGLVVVATRFDRALGIHARWLTPFVMVAPAMVSTLVMGNVQLAIIAASMIAMVLFERGRHVAGGALLAYTVVSKLFPGLLVLYLLLRRDWRAVVWTSVFATVFVAISLADHGVTPYIAFAKHMPKLLSGEAFPAFRNPAAIAINESIPGLAFKLQLFGVPYMGFAASKALGWIYTVIVVALVARLALRPVAAEREPLVWICILILATMRSPFLPTYAPFPSLWLATLLAALTWGRSGVFTTTVVAWGVLAFTFGNGAAPPPVNAIWTFVHTVTAFVLLGVALRVMWAPLENGADHRPAPRATVAAGNS